MTETPGTDKPLGQLVQRELDRPAMILGGGGSLPAALDRAPDGAVFFSVNEHGCMLVECDYAVYLDGAVGPRLREFDVVRISQHRNDTEYRLIEFTNPGNSSILAAWVAYMLGCNPIVLCGMDCYVGATYWHSPGADSPGKHITTDAHLARWRKHAAGMLAPANVRAMAGPLVDIFGQYDPLEVLPPREIPEIPAAPERAAKLDGVLIRITRGVVINSETYSPGETERVSVGMAKRIVSLGKAELIPE